MQKTENNTEISAGVSILRRKDRKKRQLGAERGNAQYEVLTVVCQGRPELMYIHLPVKGKPGELLTHKGESAA
jgi:hypothetical protein